MLPQAMLASAVAKEASDSGLRRAGLITGAANAAETVSGSIGAGVCALLLSALGFVSTQADQDVTQTMTAQIGIVAETGGVAILAVKVVLSRTAPKGDSRSMISTDQGTGPAR